jgi:hypothetical protein
MLTRTNYPEWALVMKVNFQTLGVWDIVVRGLGEERNDDDDHDDRLAMSSLLRSVPSELWSTLARKDTVKEAWDAVKNMRIGDERARCQRAAAPAGLRQHHLQGRRVRRRVRHPHHHARQQSPLPRRPHHRR